jgi:hypothetical protein
VTDSASSFNTARIFASLGHDDLVTAGNVTYIELYNAYQSLHTEYSSLKYVILFFRFRS